MYYLVTTLILTVVFRPFIKLDIAKKCGADYVINVGNCQSINNLKQEIEKLCDGGDVTVYMEVSGSPVSVHQGLQLLAPLGKFVCYSVFRDAFPADWSIIGNFSSLFCEFSMPDHLAHTLYKKEVYAR